VSGTALAVRPEAEVGGLLSQRRFVRVWAGQASGAVGDQLLPVALNLYALRAGGGVGAVGWILGGRAVALVLCLALGGLAADLLRRTRLLLSADVVRAVLLAATAVTLPRLSVGVLPVVTALVGGAEALSRPAYRSLIPVLLPDRLLERGNAAAAAAQRSSALLGALTGTAAVTAIGARWTLAAAAGVYALGAVTVAGIHEPAPRGAGPDTAPRGAGPNTALRQAAAGWQAVRQRPWAAAIMATTSVHLFAGTATALTLLPVVARHRLGGDLAYGAAIAAMAAGALPALALAGRWRPTSPGTVAVGGLLGYACVPCSLAVAWPLPAVLACWALGGFVVEMYMVYWLSALQRAVPVRLQGRVMALDQLTAFALLPLGYALVGPAVAVAGQHTVLWGGGAVVAVSTLLCLTVPGVRVLADPVPTGRPDLAVR
jgi:MFS transporter